MSERYQSIDELFADGRLIDEALKRAAEDARRLHRQLGNPMATWRDGRVVWISPDDLEAEAAAEESRSATCPKL